MKRALSFLTALVLSVSMLAGCGADSSSQESVADSTVGDSSEATTTTTTTTASQTTTTASTTEPEQTTTTQAPAEPDDVITSVADEEIIPMVPDYTEFEHKVEAQDGEFGQSLVEGTKRSGASDKSYLTGFANPETDSWQAKVELPTEQYYNVLFVIASDKKKSVTNNVVINGEVYGEIATDGSGKFQAVGFENVWLGEGENTIGLGVVDGNFDFDYMIIMASETVASLDLTYKTLPTLSNKNADYKTRAIYAYLAGEYGKTILSGQYATIGTTAETDAIYRVTGHYPAIRLSDMIAYTSEDTFANDIELAAQWSQEGGLVSYMWHWADPLGEAYYAEDTDFDLTKAIPDIAISGLSYEELEKLYEEGKITGECLAIVRDIDTISLQLAKLQEQGVTVLWRPLHEASGGWYWWGKDVDAYKWLWKLLYNRMTNYHKLNNLIWVWTGQNADWYVGAKYCDMISADIYDEPGSSQLGAFLSLRRINENKPLALSECGNAPDIQMFANEKTMWSWFGIWSGAYVIDSYGEYSEEYITKEEMIKLYSNNIVVCRDELPDFDELAKQLEKQEQEALKEQEQKPADEEAEKPKAE